MKWVKLFIVLVIGGVMGLAVGGYLGYHIGASDQSIDYSPVVKVVPVQEETHSTHTTPAPVETPEAAPAETPAETPEAAPAETPAETAPEAAPVSEAAPSGNVIEEFAITPNDQSEIMWIGYKTVLGQRISMKGGFANFSGKITVENEDPNKSFVEVTVDTTSIFSENTILTKVLKTDIFFDTAQFTEASFVSTKIEPADNGYLVTGNFKVKSETKGIQFPAIIERRADGVYVKAEFTIDRKMWNVGYDQFEDSVILKEAVISFEILAEPVK